MFDYNYYYLIVKEYNKHISIKHEAEINTENKKEIVPVPFGY